MWLSQIELQNSPLAEHQLTCTLVLLWMRNRSYHPAGWTGACSGDAMARSSILTGTALFTQRAVFTWRTRLLTAGGGGQRKLMLRLRYNHVTAQSEASHH